MIWDVQSSAFLHAQPSSSGGCDPEFRHEGVNPQMECWGTGRAGWDQCLPSRCGYLQAGTGQPFTRAPRPAPGSALSFGFHRPAA